MIEKKCLMNSKVINTLLDLISEDNIPMEVEVGTSYKEDDGNMLMNVLYRCDNGDEDLVQETICKAINLTFGLTD